ncbi:MAG: putative porin, partial [Mucinivorans sp.]
EDTTSKKKRLRKPLESFYFDDSLRATRIFAWSVNPAFNDVTRKLVDTLLDSFQVDYGFQRYGVGQASLGNLGGATIPLDYFQRPNYSNFSFVQAWDSFIMTPERVLFYNAKVPYSRLSYEMSGQTKLEEQLLHFVISHNISPSTTAHLVYQADGTKGMYMNQKALDRYFMVNVAHTGKRYAIHGGYIYNHGNVDENGGIKNDREITDTILPSTDRVAVWLKNANNTYRGHTFWWTQSYGIPLRKQREQELTIQKIPTIYIGQSFDYTIFKKVYTAKGDTALFKKTYISEDNSYDSISQTLADVKFFAQIQPYNRDGVLGLISAGIGSEFATYYNEVPTNYQNQYGQGGRQNRNSTYIYGGVNGKVSKYLDWQANVKYYLLGYRSQDFSATGALRLSAYIKKKPLTLDVGATFSLTTPDFWAQSYFSNHYAWSNAFTKESIMNLTAKFSVPSWGLYIGGEYSILGNKVYYDGNCMPVQSSAAVSVLGLYLQKDFRAGGFHFNHRVLAQFSSAQEVVPVPLLSAYLSYYFNFAVVKNVLSMNVGIDGRYNTRYYAPGYNPSTARFFNQREKQLGNYPYLDAFVSAKWKRLRILLKLQHFNANLLGNQEYFQVLHYPQNRMMFKIGISWSFYN